MERTYRQSIISKSMKFITYTGKLFDILSPDPRDIELIDIAISLSNQGRFNGQTNEYYSVAQHSVIVSRMVKNENALWGLLHDGAEAYIGDIISPLKHCDEIGWFIKRIESQIQFAIAEKFDLEWPIPDDIGIHDMRLLVTEFRDVTGRTIGYCAARGADIFIDESVHVPYDEEIKPVMPDVAMKLFMDRYKELTC